MNSPFPFGFPPATAWYLFLYVATFCLHAILMSYVFAGTFFVLVQSCFSTSNESDQPSLTDTLRDWLPLFLSAAITAGVAPLLFIQILYRDSFYTANLLLFHRWMSILPVLIVGFYLLYVLKTSWFSRQGVAVKVPIALATLACFAFTGWSWTENHLLSLQGEDVWVDHYESQAMTFFTPEMIPRLLLILAATFPTLSVWLAWQRKWGIGNSNNQWVAGEERSEPPETEQLGANSIRPQPRDVNSLMIMAVAGLVVCGISCIVYLSMMDASARKLIFGWMTLPYVIFAVMGGLLQIYAWFVSYKSQTVGLLKLALMTFGVLCMWLGIGVAREAIRIAYIDIGLMSEHHQDAATKGGVVVFLVFAVLNTAIIGFCIGMVRRGLTRGTTPPLVETPSNETREQLKNDGD